MTEPVLPFKKGDEVDIALTRLSSWDTHGRECCTVKLNREDREYYGVTTMDEDTGIRYVYVPTLDTTFDVKVVNA